MRYWPAARRLVVSAADGSSLHALIAPCLSRETVDMRWWRSRRDNLGSTPAGQPEDGDPSWADTIRWLAGHPAADAKANAELLAAVRSAWEPAIVARTSMTAMLFTIRGDAYPFDQCLFATASAAIIEFGLDRGVGGRQVARCLLADAETELDRALRCLSTPDGVLSASTADEEVWSAQLDWLRRQTQTDASALADLVVVLDPSWRGRVIPIPDQRSLTFVASDALPTAIRPLVTVAADVDGWTIRFDSLTPGQRSIQERSPRATGLAVLNRLLPMLADGNGVPPRPSGCR